MTAAVAASRPRRSPAAFLKGDEGAIGIMFAMCASVMVGAMCMSLDAIQYEMTQARMQMALDVATLSSGANVNHYAGNNLKNVAQWQKDARAYYDANMPKGYLDLLMPDSNFSANITGNSVSGYTIKLSASGTTPLLAPKIFNTDSGSGSSSGSQMPANQTVSASNSALYMPKSTLELVLVLDNTGSMGDAASTDASQGTKIEGLRFAAKNLVTNIFSQSGNDSYVGLVPFTTVVNLSGSLLPGGSWITPRFSYNATNMSMAPDPNIPQSGWQGCAVEPRDAGGNLYPQAYAPKDVPGFTPFYYNVPPTGFKVTTYNNKTDCKVTSTSNVAGAPLTLLKGSTTLCQAGSGVGIADAWGQTSGSYLTYYQNGNTNLTGKSNGPCGIQPTVFLTKDANALTDSIAGMQANGSTLIPTGLLWGWRMLSSDWSNSVSKGNGWVSTDSTLPRPESTPGLQRVAIVLTDGENAPGSTDGIMPLTSFNGLSGVGDNTLRAPTVARDTKTSLANGQMSSVTDVNAFQLGVCNAMKDNGIVIYAITFGTGASSSTAQKAMQSCASPGNYYHAPTNADLNTIFQQIAGNLGILRLTQ